MRYRNLLFALFCLLVAPIEYHFKWFGLINENHPLKDALNKPLTSGILFFYSVVLVIEALVRIESYPALAQKDEIKLLKILIGLLLIPFALFLPYIDKPLANEWLTAQWITAALSLSISLVAHGYISRHEHKEA